MVLVVFSFLMSVSIAWVWVGLVAELAAVELLASVDESVLHQVVLGLGGVRADHALPHPLTFTIHGQEEILLDKNKYIHHLHV